MKKLLLICTILFFLGFYGHGVKAQQLKKSQFKKCIQQTEFKFMDFAEFPNVPATRTIKVGEKTKELTIAEGYRVRYTFKSVKFLDLKVEYPIDGNYEIEKMKLQEHYSALGESSKKTIGLSVEKDFFGYEAMILNRHDLNQAYLTWSTNCLFDDENKRFIYVYFWNINQKKTLIDNLDKFLMIKKASMADLLKCL